MKKQFTFLLLFTPFLGGCIHLSHHTFDVIGQFKGIRDSTLYFSYRLPGSAVTRTDTVPVKEAGVFEYSGRVSTPLLVTICFPSRPQGLHNRIRFQLYNTNYLISGNTKSPDSSRIREGRIP
ncbi:MAG TPA: DUF4369 domain-containing protein [Chitinophagaceae bacterium]|nr:DUF4369 domain-containing protein [Chitinophagaceae bacterium]